MPTVLASIVIPSIYATSNGKLVNLPARMAKCPPDTKAAILALADEVRAAGGQFRLSDLFRSYDMQLQAHLDYVTKKKKAFSPAPGGSMHEGGRAFDVDLAALHIPLSRFWELAAKYGVMPVIPESDPKISEAWHFDHPGSHQLVREYYAAGKGRNLKPYTSMAVSAILSIGERVTFVKGKETQAHIQSCLIRLGHTIGNIDGDIGPKTRGVLAELGLAGLSIAEIVASLEERLEAIFPEEFFDKTEQQPEQWLLAQS